MCDKLHILPRFQILWHDKKLFTCSNHLFLNYNFFYLINNFHHLDKTGWLDYLNTNVTFSVNKTVCYFYRKCYIFRLKICRILDISQAKLNSWSKMCLNDPCPLNGPDVLPFLLLLVTHWLWRHQCELFKSSHALNVPYWWWIWI